MLDVVVPDWLTDRFLYPNDRIPVQEFGLKIVTKHTREVSR